MLTLFGLAFLSLLPTYLTKKEDKMDATDEEGLTDPTKKTATEAQPEKKAS